MAAGKTFDCTATLTDSQVLEFCKTGYLLLESVVPEFLLPLVKDSNLVGLTSLIVGGLSMLVVASLPQRSHPPRPLDFSDME